MNRLLASTAVALLLGLAPALAADESSQPPTGAGVSSEASKQATQPDSGSADTSGGAAEQSSAPPSSGAASAMKSTAGQSGDTSGGAKEQSSAPPGSSAADTSKPNPTIGADADKNNLKPNSSTE